MCLQNHKECLRKICMVCMQLTAPDGGENMIQAINNITVIPNRSQPLGDYLQMWTIQKFNDSNTLISGSVLQGMLFPKPFGFI